MRQPGRHGGDQGWRGAPGSDTFRSFLASELTTPEGCRYHTDAARSPRLADATGVHVAGGKVRRPPRDARDAEVQARLLSRSAGS